MNKLLSCALATVMSACLVGQVAAQNIATVNGKPVPQTAADYMLKQVTAQGQPATPELQQQARDAAVTREILVQEAERRGLQSDPEYLNALAYQRGNLLISALFKDQAKNHPPSDADLHAEYDAARAQLGDKEYRASHILVSSEAQAKSLIAKIKGGASFDSLAKKYSSDKGSATNGGDLDWAQPSSYDPDFAAAMKALKKGEYTQTPVKSQFGWHIIKLVDVRDAKFPSFDQVRPELIKQMEPKMRGQLVDELRRNAKLDGYTFSRPATPGTAASAPAAPAPTPANAASK